MSAKLLSHARAIALGWLLASALCSPGHADSVVLDDSVAYGRILQIGPKEIAFAPGCKGEEKLLKADVRRIIFDDTCLPHDIVPYSAGGGLCKAPINVNELKFVAPDTRYLASDYQLQGGRVHFVSPDGSLVTHGPAARLKSITRHLVCPTDVSTPPADADFCSEQQQWAVHFSYTPVLGNTILTEGVSFYLEDERGNAFEDTGNLGGIIRDAFGTAITVWMAALQDRSAKLPAQVRDAVEKTMVSRSSGGMTLLTPPQVIRLTCPDNATFVVRYASTDETQLVNPDGSDRKAARAQVEGRTILINGVWYRCWKAQPQATLYLDPETPGGPDCYNLVPILVHELGHAFGLAGHIDDEKHPSIMDSSIRPGLLRPTPEDADALAQILLKPIKGSKAGRLDADGMGVAILPK